MTRVLALFCFAYVAAGQPFDLVLFNGRIIDGTIQPVRKGAVAIRKGRIVAVGMVKGPAKKWIDVKGMVIAPGFIDVHTHAENIEHHPRAENFLRMGVTTLVIGNCGSSPLDIRAFFQRLGSKGFSANVAALVGHGTIRRQVMGGSFLRPPTAKEQAAMENQVDQAMLAGALGMSTGLIYLPGTFAKTEELVALSKVVAKHSGLYVSHMRSEGTKIFDAVDEVCRIATEARLPAHISHLKLAGKIMWGQHEKLLARLNRARAEGIRLTHDQYAYTASSTGLRQLLPDEYLAGGRAKFAELLEDPTEKRRITEWMRHRLKQRSRRDYAFAVIAHYRHDPSYNGLNIPAAARKRFGNPSLEKQVEILLEIEKNGGASGVFHGMNESDAREFLKNPHTMFASDSSVRNFQSGVPHPRGYGNAARFLARYVREQKALKLEEAVSRMTALPARTFKIKNRGELKPGYWADIVVFNPAKIQDNATFKKPHQYATGFRHVLVNGKEVVQNDKHNGTGPGQIIRRGK